jgi:hypothetical protein
MSSLLDDETGGLKCYDPKVRGQRVPFNERDGEVDVEFWAQATANQAAARAEQDGDEGQFLIQSGGT